MRTNKRLKEANSELASEKKHAEKRAAASEAGQAKERKKIKLLDEEKAASLSREKDTEASLQKKIDENKIQSKAILRDSGKRAAVVMEKEKLNLQNKNKKLKKELAGVKAGLVEQNRRHEAEKAKLRDKLSKQIATLKGEIVILKNKMQRSNYPSITGRQSVEDTEVEESEAEESSGGPSKIQPRLVKRLKAAEILAPRKMIASKIEASVWSEAEPSIKRMARQNDAHDLGAMIFSISRGNAKWAADAVFRWLQKEENSVVSDKVENMIVNTQKLVVQGIHASIQSQSRAKGSRNRASETFVKNVVAACLFTIVKQKEDVCDNEPKRLLGTSVNQISLARTTIRDLKNQ